MGEESCYDGSTGHTEVSFPPHRWKRRSVSYKKIKLKERRCARKNWEMSLLFLLWRG